MTIFVDAVSLARYKDCIETVFRGTHEMIFIFDLDGTVIDTSHRYRDLPCGKIDLDYWFANSTPEMIAKDTLLPIADVWKRYHSEGHTIVVCTARSFSPLNGVDLGQVYLDYLSDNGLLYDAILHRELAGPDHETLSDGDLKTRLLNEWAEREGLPCNWRKDAVMYDDNQTVIRKMLLDRLVCFDAVAYNRRLAA